MVVAAALTSVRRHTSNPQERILSNLFARVETFRERKLSLLHGLPSPPRRDGIRHLEARKGSMAVLLTTLEACVRSDLSSNVVNIPDCNSLSTLPVRS